ncbi:MAG: hypothetical protein AB7P40_26805 [Chloroflexota bacterium]
MAEQPANDHPSDVERVTVFFEDGHVTLLPRRAPVGNSAPIRGVTLAVFPVPDGSLLALNLGPSSRSAPRFCAVTEPDTVPATAILGLSEAEAVQAASALGFGRVFFWDGRRASLLDCPAAPTGSG